MPIDINIVDNNSTIKNVHITDNNSEVKVKSNCSISNSRLEALIRELQKTKQNLGFIYLDDYLPQDEFTGTIPTLVLNLLISYLINKIKFKNNIYSLSNELGNYLEYVCVGVIPNTIKINKTTGEVTIYNTSLTSLNYHPTNHKGFAGIEFGTTEYWDERPTYVPVEGMIIVYTDYDSYVDEETGETIYIPAIKVGDGNAYLIDKPFIGDNIKEALVEHVDNSLIHVSEEDRLSWNNKITCDDNAQDSDMLVFTRD